MNALEKAERAAFRRYNRARRQAPEVLRALLRIHGALMLNDLCRIELAFAEFHEVLERHPEVREAKREWGQALRAAVDAALASEAVA